MSRRSTVEDWRRAVYASPHVSDATRVLLLFLADEMRSDLRVSVKRERIAKALGRSERTIADRLREAVGEKPGQDPSHRLLDRVVRGQKHRQAVYAALLPDVLSVNHGVPTENTSQGEAPQHAENDEILHPENPSLSVNPAAQGEPRGSRLSKRDTTCQWHPFDVCPGDCRNADDRSTA